MNALNTLASYLLDGGPGSGRHPEGGKVDPHVHRAMKAAANAVADAAAAAATANAAYPSAGAAYAAYTAAYSAASDAANAAYAAAYAAANAAANAATSADAADETIHDDGKTMSPNALAGVLKGHELELQSSGEKALGNLHRNLMKVNIDGSLMTVASYINGKKK
jgi:hypothetical protein